MPTANDVILSNILSISQELVSFNETTSAIEKILTIAIDTVSVDGYFFFKVTPDKQISLRDYKIKSIQHIFNKQDAVTIFSPRRLTETQPSPSKTVTEICANNLEIVCVDNIHNHTDIDTSSFAKLEELYSYSTTSVLAIPLIDCKNILQGVAVFINAKDNNGKNINFTPQTKDTLNSICHLATLVLENKHLREAYSSLLESFIEVIIRATTAKSPSTSNHCQRVPIIVKLLASVAVEEDTGPLKKFEMSKSDWHALNLASYLHDCGKLTTPEHIMEKATKLETINNRIHEIRNRFEIMRRDAHIRYLQKRLADIDSKENLQASFVAEIKQLEDDFSFVARCNTGDSPLSDSDKERLDKIANQTFTRYFNRMLGLSWGEKNSISTPESYTHPAQEPLLQDRLEHLKDGYNHGELYNLKIEKGTINKEERKKINEHINVTIDMLKALPSTSEIEKIIEYAGCHHEWVNGKGYPNQLTGDQMSIPAKIMAIADVFEALTAKDRPYKSPKKLSETLRIMQEMKNIGHLDPDVYRTFITHQVYLDYAQQYLEPEQIDDVIPEEYL